jgi:hypothetical protein
MVSNDLAKLFNWQGRRGKRSFRQLQQLTSVLQGKNLNVHSTLLKMHVNRQNM